MLGNFRNCRRTDPTAKKEEAFELAIRVSYIVEAYGEVVQIHAKLSGGIIDRNT